MSRARPVPRALIRASLLVAAALPLSLSLAGCGQKGALYLPDAGGEVVTRPTQTPAEPAAATPAAPGTPAPPPAEERSDPATPAPPR